MPDDRNDDVLNLGSFGTELNAAVIGASGGIGKAIADDLERCHGVSRVFRLSRSRPQFNGGKNLWLHLDLESEATIAEAVATIDKTAGKLHLAVVASGILHGGNQLQPEKTWRVLSSQAMCTAFQINTIGPTLVAKHFLPLLAKNQKSVFAALSARVGSIADNGLGGWYSYRASKAALNMVIKTLSIELARRNPQAICVALHPGTVDTMLSRPFQSGVSESKLFSPAQSARHLLTVLDNLSSEQSGALYAWDGSKIPF